jgi:hypothetical protein
MRLLLNSLIGSKIFAALLASVKSGIPSNGEREMLSKQVRGGFDP